MTRLNQWLVTGITLTGLALITLANVPTTQAESTKYSVFCAGGKVTIDGRTLDQMKSARGSDTCQFGQFNFRMDAMDFAKQFGGEGASCHCK